MATFAVTSEEIKRTYDGKFAMSFDPMHSQMARACFFRCGSGRVRRADWSEREIESGIFHGFDRRGQYQRSRDLRAISDARNARVDRPDSAGQRRRARR